MTQIESKSSSQNKTASDRPAENGGAVHGSLRGYAYIALATCSWGIAAALGRAVFTGRLQIGGETLKSIDPVILSQTRTTFAFMVLMPLLLGIRGKQGIRMSRGEILQCMLLGTAGVAGSNYFYYLAIQRTSVATAIILQYLAPVFVLLYMLLRKLQPATFQRLSGVSLAVVGSILAIGVVSSSKNFPFVEMSSGQVRFDRIGVSAGIIAALCFGFYNIFGRHLIETNDRWRVLLYAMMGAAIGWLILNPPWKVIAAHYTGAQWLFLFVFAVMSMLIPYSFYFTGLQYLDATRAIVTSCLEPVFAILIAAFALGELVTPVQIAGIVVTLAATVLVQLPDRKGKAIPVELME